MPEAEIETSTEQETVLPNTDTTADTPPVENPLAAPETPVGTEGEEIVSWLPEDLRGNERLQGFESPEALARAFAEAELAQALPEEYTLPEGQPPELGVWAKNTKLSQEQLDAILQLKAGVDTYEADTRNRVYADGRKQLFDAWGDKKDENLKIAESVFSTIPSGQKLATFIKNTGEGANPVVIQALHEIGNYLKEGGYVKNENVTQPGQGDVLRKRYPTMFSKDEE